MPVKAVKVRLYKVASPNFDETLVEIRFDFPAYASLSYSEVQIFSTNLGPPNSPVEVTPPQSYVVSVAVNNSFYDDSEYIADFICFQAQKELKKLELPEAIFKNTIGELELALSNQITEGSTQWANGEPIQANTPYLHFGGNHINYSVQDELYQNSGFSTFSNQLPGVNTKVSFPCRCLITKAFPTGDILRSVIIHLNDYEKWSREKIADWLDELHDSGTINIEF